MNSFVCSTCGETHDGLPTDHGWKLPDVVWAIPEDERTNRAKFDSDLCQFGDRFFIRCVLKLPFNEQPEYYGWGVWVEVQSHDFYRYLELFDKDGSNEPPVLATVANEMPGYPSTLGLPVELRFQNSTSRPAVVVRSTSNHILAAEQSSGIDNERYHQIILATGCGGGP